MEELRAKTEEFLENLSKKAQKEYYSKQRHTWGELNPVTRSVPSGKVYNRKKEKRRIDVESGNGFDADFFVLIVQEEIQLKK